MCEHPNGKLTIRSAIDTTYVAGAAIDTRALGADRVVYSCADCGALGDGDVRDPGLPRWVAERLAALPRSAR